jgi:L-rhamnose mutarotase
MHDNLWPGVAQSMQENGIAMIIHHQSDGRLFVFATAPDEAAWQRSRHHPAMPAWQAAMTELIETDDTGNVLYEHLEEVFRFDPSENFNAEAAS